MPGPFLDPKLLHTAKIKAVNGPLKTFATKEGQKEKYQVIFENGYEAEYCPLVGQFDKIFTAGGEVMFRIGYRGPRGDEIEPAKVSMEKEPGGTLPRTMLTNMHSHPVVISLNAAMRYHAEINKGTETELSDILGDAEVILEWLDKQINIEHL